MMVIRNAGIDLRHRVDTPGERRAVQATAARRGAVHELIAQQLDALQEAIKHGARLPLLEPFADTRAGALRAPCALEARFIPEVLGEEFVGDDRDDRFTQLMRPPARTMTSSCIEAQTRRQELRERLPSVARTTPRGIPPRVERLEGGPRRDHHAVEIRVALTRPAGSRRARASCSTDECARAALHWHRRQQVLPSSVSSGGGDHGR